MYCYHCGLEIDETKAIIDNTNVVDLTNSKNPEQVINRYICPRCGHLVYSGASEEDYKSLSCAAHAQVQRASNSFARGMTFLCIGGTLLILALLFLVLAKKPTATSIVVTSPEFIVFIILGAISIITLLVGAIFTSKGVKLKKKYISLLKDINNKTFVQ